MPQPMKIATCCYCGVKATLVLDRARHELKCRACGAPLHKMKMLPIPAKPLQSTNRKPAITTSAKRHKYMKKKGYNPRKPQRISIKDRLGKRLSWGRERLEDLWDEIEDIFD